jgi:Bacterial protein of unknown function (HtrL_YibB)
MHYNITDKLIETVNFAKFNETIKYSLPNDLSEFGEVPGKQHYRLLSYFSSLFNNSIIIDIGTHRGNSALALSYNETNVIHTFDIVDNVVNTEIKNLNNVNFHIENLFDSATFEKWKNTILSSPFIFLDVDPHNGFMEMDFYNLLKNINYQGFVICDEIWYFKEMRDNFWHKIPYEERYDLTNIGHWSGTGVFTFNKEITFEKNDNSNWTLVTAYFNLTKCPDASEEINKRDKNYYFQHSISTLSLPYNLVIYCDSESFEEIEKIRPKYLKNKTHYVICDFDDFVFKNKDKRTFKEFRNKINQNRIEKPYSFDNRNTASYYLFCLSRYIMLKETIVNNHFNSTHFSWINFCIERMGYKNLIRLDEALSIKRDKFSTCYIDYIPEDLVKNTQEYFLWGRCSMCSGFFTGNSEYMYKVCDLIENKFLEYLEKGYGHADEQLYSPVYFENVDLFEHYYGDYQQMITNYVYVYESPESPSYNFIRNSFQHRNFIKCYEACKFLWKSHCLNKCELNEQCLFNLFWYYMQCKKQLMEMD